jgi:type VI secretion system protein ImpI
MGLTLTIENESSLPDGGPLSVRVTGKRGLDIGRDSHLDWTLPDPTRFISSKHCEVRYREGGYWLHDVSTNGTFLNGSDGRMKGPHRLRHGDRVTIGQYIVAVELDGEEGAPQRDAAPAPTPQPTAYRDLWSSTGTGETPPPIDPKLLRPPRSSVPVRPDFLDWAVDVPDTVPIDPAVSRAPAAPNAPEDVWAQGPARAVPAPEPPPAAPAPRRPIWVSGEPSGPWGASQQPAEPVEEMPPPAETDPSPAPQAPARASAASADFVRDLARGAGLPESYFAQNPQELAQQVGALLRLVTENMQQLLNARGQSKRLARMSQQTTIEALNNNPLKFAPSTEEALRIMFGAPTPSYLDARRALEEAFTDVKDHQVRTYAAMQQALAMIVADLDPQAIDDATDADRGISGMIGSRKARLWDTYVARWQAKTRGQSDGLVDVFMQYFAECYDRGVTTKR